MSRDLDFTSHRYNTVNYTRFMLLEEVPVDIALYLLDAVAGHDINDSTTYHSKPYKPICLNTEPSVEGLRVGIPKVIYCVSCHTSVCVLSAMSNITVRLGR